MHDASSHGRNLHFDRYDPVAKLSISAGQITLIPKPELRGFWGDPLAFHHHFGVTSAEVAIICPDFRQAASI